MGNNSTLNVLSGHTITINGEANTQNGLGFVIQSGATLIITGCLTGNNNFNLNISGSLQVNCIMVNNNGTLIIQGTGSVSVTNNLVVGSNATITVGGTLTVGGNSTINSGTLTVNGTVNISGQYTGPTPTGSGGMQDIDEVFLGALPVNLADFTLNNGNDFVIASWITLSEINNSHFIVEHASEDLNFSIVGKVSGNNNSNQEIKYSFKHYSPVLGWNFYRLKQVDFNGVYEYSNIQAIRFSESKNNRPAFLVYPNPNNGIEIFIDNKNSEWGDVDFKIINVSGLIVLEDKINLNSSNKVILKQMLPHGTYFLIINNIGYSFVVN